MTKKMLYILIIIILIIAGIFVATKISEKDKIKSVIANSLNNTNKNNEQNEVKENSKTELETNEILNDIENSDVETGSANIAPEERAKQIVKENWGEDDSVYYSYDGIDGRGRYVICVREIETTKALYRYYVDIETETFDIE